MYKWHEDKNIGESLEVNMNNLKTEQELTRQKGKNILRQFSSMALLICGKLKLLFPVDRLKVVRFRRMNPLKLNIGCGQVKFSGWVNIDVDPKADLVIDIRKGLPFGENSVDFIYNEHFLEHLTFEEGEKCLIDFHRCLKKGGVLRIATPDLDYAIQKYNTDWKNQD